MRTAAAVLLALILALPVFAASRVDEPVPAASPVPQVGDSPTAQLDLVRRLERQRHVRPILDVLLHPQRPVRPVVPVPTPRLVVVRVHAEPQPSSHRASGTATGRASWYDDGPGLYAAAGPALRKQLGVWRGQHVVVRANGVAVRVVLSDWCQCYWKRPNERVIDLSPAAFSQLAPLSRGLVKVTVSWT